LNPPVLIAPLCWGLGHATRCIPLIRHYLSEGKTVVLASDSEALALLRAEFPMLPSVALPAYRITYTSHNMAWNMFLQLPKILKTIVAEHFALRKIVAAHDIQTIISDHRYGCFQPKIHSIFLSHQINIKIQSHTEKYNWVEKIIGAFHRLYISRFFNETWIPDLENEAESLAGALSHGKLPQPHHYIGIQTRFALKKTKTDAYNSLQTEKKPYLRTRIVAVLSGPEPQRTFFENSILAQAQTLNQYDFTIVQGKPNTEPPPTAAHIQLLPFLTADALFECLENADAIITRSGYSSLMDLSILQKPTLLVPTIGQTEQEYLARRCAQKPNYTMQNQTDLDLAIWIKNLPPRL
jgi:UDP:flavonoid glycosyltransferase YjiC (YdhE family)